MKTFAVAVALTAGLLAATAGEAKELRMATIGAQASAWGPMIQGFADRVGEISGGSLTVTPYWAGQLGNQQDTLNMMLRGRLDIWIGPGSSLGVLAEETTIYGLPYLFKDRAQAVCTIEKTQADMAKIIEPRAHFLGFQPNAWVDVASKSEMRTPDDFKGVKIRTGAQEVAVNFWNTVGAQAVPMPIGEMNQSLATNLVHAGETVLQYYRAISTDSVAPFYIKTNHYYNVGAFVMSNKAWKGLSDEEKAFVDQAAEETLNYSKLSDMLNDSSKAVTDDINASGATIVELTEDELALWRAKGEESREAVMKGLTESSQAFYQTVLAAIKDCGE